ncbi:MAG: glycosyltransferase [Cyanobacteria bacterium P01_A01_bin.68]
MNNNRKILRIELNYPKDSAFIPPNEDTIYACINPPVEKVKEHKAISIPYGKFDINDLLKQLPQEWFPDAILVSSSLARVNNSPIPTGIQNLNCPSVLKLYDSHYPNRQIQTLIEYAQALNCQYNWVIYDRHHVHFFAEAGIPNLFWTPSSLTMPIVSDYTLPTFTEEKVYDIIFSGSVDNSHPYRCHLLNYLKENGINLKIERYPLFTDYLKACVQSKIVFNCSMNGDTSRRIFEVMMGGGFLLTDRLSQYSGLPKMFKEGIHLECYGSEEELLEKTKYYIANPYKALEIARAGHKEFMNKYHPQILQDKFFDFLIKGESIPSTFLVNDDSRLIDLRNKTYDKEALQLRINTYELLQEIYRLNNKFKVLYYQAQNQSLLTDLADLQRLNLKVLTSATELEENTDTFDIIMLDLPTDIKQAKQCLQLLIPYIKNQGILMYIGNFSQPFAKQLDSWCKTQAFKRITLANGGEAACLTYQNISKVQESESVLSLHIAQKKQNNLLQKSKQYLKKIIAMKSN